MKLLGRTEIVLKCFGSESHSEVFFCTDPISVYMRAGSYPKTSLIKIKKNISNPRSVRLRAYPNPIFSNVLRVDPRIFGFTIFNNDYYKSVFFF